MRVNSVFLSEEQFCQFEKLRRVYQRDGRSVVRDGHLSRVCAAEAAAMNCRKNRGRLESGSAFSRKNQLLQRST
jgi:hypothetical protein